MKIVSISLFENEDCRYAEDLTFVSYFNRHSVAELMREMVREAVLATVDARKVFEHPPWQILVWKTSARHVAMVTDNEYPVSVAYEVMSTAHSVPLGDILRHCQDPRAISPMYRVRQQLDETLVIMHENVDKIIQRSEDIAVLVEKSERLSASSKMFYKVARKHNRCCLIS